MFGTIVWATDGTPFADRALPLVMALARANGSRIVAVHANELLLGRGGAVPLLVDEDDLESRLTSQVSALRRVGLSAELKVRTAPHSSVAELVAETAADVDPDLIVIATHARLLGSVTRTLIAKAECPVLVVPPHTEVSGGLETELLTTA